MTLESLLRQYQATANPQPPSEEQTTKSLTDVVTRLRVDPFVNRYLQEMRDGWHLEHTKPWQAIGEQRATAMALAMSLLGQSGAPYQFDPEVPRVECARAAIFASWAQPYYWNSQTFEAARTVPLPDHVVDARQVAIFPPMFWSLPVAYGDDKQDIDWFLIYGNLNPSTTPDYWITVVFGITDVLARTTTVAFSGIPDGYQWHKSDTSLTMGGVLKGLAFLASPFVDSGKQRLHRNDRKLAARMSVAPLDDDAMSVNVVQLRALPPSHRPHEDSDASVEYRHRWWVRGHIRAQWYPSIGRHRPIWVAPHIKGPDDAPFVNRVNAVVR